MGKLIEVVGASGVGKTSLVRALTQAGDFAVAYEQHVERPFQTFFAESARGTGKKDAHYALANQLDFFLYRAEQEKELRADERSALMDGGLDLDFHGFTRLFRARRLLNEAEFDLCRRFYELTRSLLPPPDLVIHLVAREEIVRQRLAARQRINIATAEDTALFNEFLEEWLATISAGNLLRLDVSSETEAYGQSTKIILERLVRLE